MCIRLYSLYTGPYAHLSAFEDAELEIRLLKLKIQKSNKDIMLSYAKLAFLFRMPQALFQNENK